MSERIQGLSISLDLETAGVERSLSQIKNSFSSLRRSAQVNMNNMKFDSKDLKTYKRNLDGLSDSYERQEQNVDDISKRMKQMEEAGKGNTEEFKKLNAEYNRQVDELNKLGHALDRAQEGLRDVYNESSRLTQLGNTFSNIGSSLQDVGSRIQGVGTQIQGVGRGLTRHITMPAVGVVSAIGGITAAFGWGRLTSLDTAQAQLKGLGYETEDVERITDGLVDTLDGGMMTMGDAVFASANAMAAGVEEGKELDKYIRMLDASVQGGTGTFEEMEQIFSRVADQGSLTRTEFDMMQKRIPGFSSAVQEHFGVSQDAMYEMLSNGEVTLDEFLKIMEDHGGAFAEEYSQTWAGMVENTKNYIGIIGETLLGGVFDQAKEAIAELIEYLKSDEVVAWAERAGESISTAFGNIVDSVKSGIEWFVGLGAEKQKLIGIAGLVVTALGPILTVLGTMTIFIGSVVSTIGGLIASFGGIAGGIATVMQGVKPFAEVFPKLSLLVKGLGAAFGVLTGPIGITVGIVAALGAAFVLAYNKSETFRDFIAGLGERFKGAWESVMQFKDNVVTAFQGIFAIFQGDDTKGNSLLRSIGLSEETIDKIFLAVFHIQNAFTTIKDYVMQALGAVTTFVQEKIAQIVAFWNTDGQQILQAVKNIFSGISTAISATFNFIMPIIQSALNGILNIFKVVWPAVLFVVQMVWENIKGVINGGLNIIKGLVQVFSGIFTGDFSKMWEGVKNIFSGAIEFVWNLFQLMFWGRIIKGITSFVRGGLALFRNFGTQTGTVFTNMWQAVVRIFTNLWQGAVRIFNNMRTGLTNTVQNINTRINNIISRMVSAVLNFFRNLFTRSVQTFNNMRNSITNTASNLRSRVVSTISNMATSVVRFFTNLFNRGRQIFTNLRTSIVNSISRMRDGVVNGVSRMRDRALDVYRNLKDKAAGFLDDMVDGAKALPGKMGTAIKNGASKAVDGIKSLGNSMVGKLGDVVNGVIKGLNSITSKIGISATIDEWSVPKFSTGTGQGSPTGSLTKSGKIAMDTLATVGDKGPGNGKGTRELVHYPNGKVGLYDNDATIFAPKGTTIYNNQETESMLDMLPKFSKGTGMWDKIKGIASKAVDYITNPKKIFEDLISAVGGGFKGLNGLMGTLAKGAFNFLKDKFLSWITERFSESSVGKKQKWMDYRMTTPYSPNKPVPGYPTSFNGGRHYGIDYATPVGVNITAPFAGKVKKQSDVGGGNVARLQGGNASQYFLHMSSVKPGSVGVGDSVGKSGNTGKYTTGPHVHWQHEEPKTRFLQNKNTKNPLKMIKGHLRGGKILTDGLFNLHGGEYVINPNQPTEAMKLIALAGKQLAGKSKQTRELPNPTGGNKNHEEMMMKMQQQIDLLTQLVTSNKAIENKELKIGDNQIGQANDRYSSRQSSRQSVKTGRMSYV